MNDGTGLSERLRWLLPKKLSDPLPLSLDRVGDPVWSPDGRSIIVSGVKGLSGVSGPIRANYPWSLWALDPRTLRLTELDSALDDLNRGAWSPDSRLYAVNERRPNGDTELTLIDVSSRRKAIVAHRTTGEVAWIGQHTLATAGASGRRLEIVDAAAAIRKLDKR